MTYFFSKRRRVKRFLDSVVRKTYNLQFEFRLTFGKDWNDAIATANNYILNNFRGDFGRPSVHLRM